MKKTRWYKEAIVYQVYPFSFMDSNNDGWGDINGIISKLDHIKKLGATAIWFSPLYDSPDYDYGYDIRDYKKIDKKFGSMKDFDRLLKECHSRGLKVIMDMVINHTSTEHIWFKKALEGDPKYKDYYIIRKGIQKEDKLLPPTNWEAVFTGSAWERIDNTDEFYLHLFCKEQADLNWENPSVRKEIINILNFWLKKGVDGFRFDVFNLFSKVYPLQDDSKGNGSKYFVDGPRMHEFLNELNTKALSLYDSYTVGETYHPSKEACNRYIAEASNELDTVFNFEHLASDNIKDLKYFKKPFNLKQFKEGLFTPQIEYFGNGWNTLVLENHDNQRSVCRFGIDYKHYRYEAATFLATITYMGFGIPFIYMGQEIGMVNSKFKTIDECKDAVSHFIYNLLLKYHVPKKLALSFINYGARDHARIPMHWDDTFNAGFNMGYETWQKGSEDYSINAKNDLTSEKSIYKYYQNLLKIKKKNKIAIYGETKEYDHENNKMIAYSRTYKNKKLFIVGNFSNSEVTYALPEEFKEYDILLSNYEDNAKEIFKPYEARVYSK